jgi:hypothetical protein
MTEKLKQLESDFNESLAIVKTQEELKSLESEYLGKK